MFPPRPYMAGGNFYSRPCGRGDVCAVRDFNSTQVFLLTPLREGRRGDNSIVTYVNAFLLTPLREGRPKELMGDEIEVIISTHAPAGGATQRRWPIWSSITFLLTPPREGRRTVPPQPGPRLSISTHAPAGGATFLSLVGGALPRQISTHAPAGGATISSENAGLECKISTHAPAGGATNHRIARLLRRKYFYSRPCGRGDR